MFSFASCCVSEQRRRSSAVSFLNQSLLKGSVSCSFKAAVFQFDCSAFPSLPSLRCTCTSLHEWPLLAELTQYYLNGMFVYIFCQSWHNKASYALDHMKSAMELIYYLLPLKLFDAPFCIARLF